MGSDALGIGTRAADRVTGARVGAAPSAATRRPRRILNHDIMGCTAEGVVGNHLYSGRALGASQPGDIVQLHPDLRPQWRAISAHYRRIGLAHSSEVIWDTRRGFLAAHPDLQPSVFFFGAEEQAARPDERWYRAVWTINSKNGFIALAHALGVPVPTTLCFDRAAEIDATAVAAAPFPCYLKAAVSVSGVGIHRCADAEALRRAAATFGPDVPVQIQDEVRTPTFLNLQYETAGGRACRVAATEQVLDGFVHQGNRHPVADPPWPVVEPMADWLAAEGIQGIFAFDVARIETADGRADLAIECNPRWNGASYPTVVAQRLGIEHWVARAFPTRHRMLEAIDLDGLEYEPAAGSGVILINWGPVLVGKLLVLLAGTPAQQQQLAAALGERL